MLTSSKYLRNDIRHYDCKDNDARNDKSRVNDPRDNDLSLMILSTAIMQH
jgi:hypothetical protein